MSERKTPRLKLADLPTSAQLDVAVGGALRRAREVRARHGKDLARRSREAHRLAEVLIALPELQARKRILRNRGSLYSPQLVARLTECSGKAAAVDAAEGLRIAELASLVLDQIPRREAQKYSPRYRLDLWAGIEAERGNALRILGARKEAREGFRKAFELARIGTGDASVAARVASLAGSLFWSRGRMRAASEVFTFAATLYSELGEVQALGKVQIALAGVLDDRGLVAEAIELQEQALSRLDEDKDPTITLAAHANLAEMMQRTGNSVEALGVLADSEPLVSALSGTAPALGTWLWIRGRCRLAAGSLDGEADLHAAWRILEATENTYDLGLLGVDLCRHYLDRCSLQQLEHWIGPTVRYLERHAPTPDIVRELAKLQESVQKLNLNAAQVGQVLDLVSKTMGQRSRR